MVSGNNILLIATMVVLIMSIAFMFNLSILGYSIITGKQITGVPQNETVTCPDGFCDTANGENCTTCSQDCGACPVQDNTFLIIGITAGGMICMIFLVIYFVKISPAPKKRILAKEEFIPDEEEIVTYISKMRSSSYSDAQIRASLVKAGWKPGVIDRTLVKYRRK